MKAPRRTPLFNTLLILGIVAVFVIAGVIIWNVWSADAVTAADGGGPDTSILYAAIVIGGPLMLLVALVIAKLRSRKVTKAQDPRTPADDPGRGM